MRKREERAQIISLFKLLTLLMVLNINLSPSVRMTSNNLGIVFIEPFVAKKLIKVMLLGKLNPLSANPTIYKKEYRIYEIFSIPTKLKLL